VTVLVGYSSKYGATEGIAERIAAGLRKAGLEVDARPVGSVRDPAAYDAFVIGASAYMGSWRKDATRFVRRHRDLLAARPVWLFSSGPLGTGSKDADGRDRLVTAQPKQFRELAEIIGPRAVQVFFGAMDPSTLRGRDRLVSRIPSVEDIMPAGDFRDWPAIDAWTESIANDLSSTTQSFPA